MMDLLTQLRDLHSPPPISFWPMAMGWYFLIALICILSASVFYFLYRQRKKTLVKRLILRRISVLHSIEKNPAVFMELSSLLKKAALHRYPREKVASLQGESWLQFLDQTLNGDSFSKGVGRLLILLPYQAHIDAPHDELISLVETWVTKNL